MKLLEKIYTEGLYGIASDEENATRWCNLKTAYAAGLDGEWEGSVDMGEDAKLMVFTYQFKTEGERLTGSSNGYGGIGYGEGQKWIQNGRIDGNDFSFTLNAQFGAAEIVYTGIFWGDRIELSYTTKASGHRSSHTRSLNNRFSDSDDIENPTFTLTARRVE